MAQEHAPYRLETERVTAILAGTASRVQLAVSGRLGEYRDVSGERGAPSDAVREYCDSLPSGEALSHPECVLLQEYEYLSSGRFDALEALFIPGPWREQAIATMSARWPQPGQLTHESLGKLQAEYAPYRNVTPVSVYIFNNMWYLSYVAHAGASFRLPAAGKPWPDPAQQAYFISYNVAQYDETSGRFWLTSNKGSLAGLPRLAESAMRAVGSAYSGGLQDFDQEAMAMREFPMQRLEGPPAGLAAWRVEPANPPEDRDQSRVRLVQIADPSAPGAIGKNDLILYFNTRPLRTVPPAAVMPFLHIDSVLLDDAGRTLQSELARALVVSDGGAPFDERYLDTIHPAAHDRLREEERHRLASQAQSGGVSPVATPLGFPADALPSLRVVSHVDTGECVVWFGWLPDAMTALRRRTGAPVEPIADDRPGQFVTVVQRKADGDLRLTFNEAPGLLGPERLAVEILTSPGVAESLVRARLPAER